MQETAVVDSAVIPALYTVATFAERHRTWATQAVLRNHILHAADRLNSRGERIAGNKLLESGAIVRLGRRVYIDEARFFDWLAREQKKATRDVKAAP